MNKAKIIHVELTPTLQLEVRDPASRRAGDRSIEIRLGQDVCWEFKFPVELEKYRAELKSIGRRGSSF